MAPPAAAFQPGDDGVDAFGQRGACIGRDDLLQALDLESSAVFDNALGDTIGENVQGAAGEVEHLVPQILLLDIQWQYAQRRGTCLDGAEVALAVLEQRRLVAGIRQPDLAVRRIEYAADHGDEHAVNGGLAEFAVDGGQQGGRFIDGLAKAAKQACRLRHEQRCIHALAGYIAQAEIDAAVAEFVEIVKIAGDLVGGQVDAVHGKRCRALIRQQAALHLAGKLQFAADAFLLDQFLGHACIAYGQSRR